MTIEIRPSKRIASLPAYAFAAVDERVAELRAKGISPIDFGVGDPTVPTPELVRRATQRGVDERAEAGYPSYVGATEFREAVAGWMKRRFGVSLDPEREICSTIGSKEAIFHFPEALIDPGDVVVCPSPGYPPWSRGTLFAEGTPFFLPLRKESGFLPDLGSIPEAVLKRTKILWVSYPNSPTGTIAPDAFWKEVVAFCERRGILLASDEAYSELYFTDRPARSALEHGKEGIVVFQSLSKRSAMTGYRIGWVCGDARAVSLFKKLKTNIDSGTPTFIQDGAVAALADERHVAGMREDYRRKRDAIAKALVASGLEDCTPQGTIYLWQRAPKGMSSVDFALRLMAPDTAIVTTPGAWISEKCADGANPGEGYVRFALVPPFGQIETAAARLRAMKW